VFHTQYEVVKINKFEEIKEQFVDTCGAVFNRFTKLDGYSHIERYLDCSGMS